MAIFESVFDILYLIVVIGIGVSTANMNALAGLSGLGHIILSVGLVMIMKKIIKLEKKEAFAYQKIIKFSLKI